MERIDLQELRELVEFLKESGIAEFELEREDQHVKLKFESAFSAPAAHAASSVPQMHAASAPTAALVVPSSAPPAAPVEEALHVVKSPIVGTYYESSAPGSPAFVKVGDSIDLGQTLCIVEAMKLMNEIESDVAGEVVKIIAKNGQPVEYGQPLFAVRAR